MASDYSVHSVELADSMLPNDLVQYLSGASNRTLKLPYGEIRTVLFYSHDQVPKKRFDVAHYVVDPAWDDIEDRKWFEGYDLVKKCNSYAPEGIMIWFPDWGEYGQWDSDHHTIITFPKTDWTTILKFPQPYFNCEWENGVRNRKVNPWA